MLRLKISDKEYDLCRKASENMACSQKKGYYGGGCINTPGDPFRAERTGRLGEVGLAFHIGVEPDLEYHAGGDRQDFIFRDFKIDVKTSRYNRGTGYVLAVSEWGKYIPLTSDIYVFAYILKEDRKKRYAIVDYAGFLYKEEIIREPSKAPRGRHLNYVIPFSELRPLEELLDEQPIKVPRGKVESGKVSQRVLAG